MERNAILQKINQILSELTDRYQQLESDPQSFTSVDLELFIANAKFLADHAQILQRLPDVPVIEQAEAVEVSEELVEETPAEVSVEPEVCFPTPTLAEEQKPTVNDLLSDRSEANLAARLSKDSSTDLKSLISMNDKLAFIKELFNGYSLAYQEAIEVLNRCEDFNAADAYLRANYFEKYAWSEKTKIADKFYELLNKRFAK